MFIDFLLERFQANRARDAIVWRDRRWSYGWLADEVSRWTDRLDETPVPPGSVVSLEADFSPTAVALLLALVERRCIVVPLTTSVETQKSEFREVAEVEVVATVDSNDEASFARTGRTADHPLIRSLVERDRPGLVLFSSGSTGRSKGSLHDFAPLLEKFHLPRHSRRAITFLLFDHIGGVNTLLYTLSNAGCVITTEDRAPDAVCRTIEKHRAELLPTSPTFLNLILLSEAYRRHDLSSLELVTYGTEVMPESTLRRFHALFPDIRLLQTYGLSEVGILRSRSRSSDSLWVKVGGEGFQTRIVNGMLEIRAASAMLGYLNHETPFTDDGWFRTGDAVEVDGEEIRILGRGSEIINVGGEKVYPAEVENELQLMDGVEDVVVSGERHPITGQIVTAQVKLSTGESPSEFRSRMNVFLRGRLPRFKIPRKVVLTDTPMHGARFKKMR
ncbi:MAG: long-chain fatty acid--CoA ligase [Gemmatimonadales bacterium]|nr:MAG: long-chain fatty acid--CoA ligase [Gemmatimonadales bacterium]